MQCSPNVVQRQVLPLHSQALHKDEWLMLITNPELVLVACKVSAHGMIDAEPQAHKWV